MNLQRLKTKREALIIMSQHLKSAYPGRKVNDALLGVYRAMGFGSTFKTAEQWKAEGCILRPEAKPFVVWGAPQPKRTGEGTYFPIKLVFSEIQLS